MLNADLSKSTFGDLSDPALGGANPVDRSSIRELIKSGMRKPELITIPRGERLYRFASSQYAPQTWEAGPWWIFERDYVSIVKNFRTGQLKHGSNALPMGYHARSALAVRPSWSRVDSLVKVFIKEDIQAYQGYGQTQHRELLPNGMYLTLPGAPDVLQIFIPNVGSRGKLTASGMAAFSVLERRSIDSYDFLKTP
jgi:hypothetical protein